MNTTILIVEDEERVFDEIEAYLEGLDYTIIHAINSEDAYKVVMKEKIDIVMMDIFLEESNGIDIAKKIKKAKNIPIVFLTTDIDEETIDKAVSIKPAAYLSKPFNCKELQVAIKIGLNLMDNTAYKGDMILDDEFSFEAKDFQLICCGTKVHLTKKERQLFKLLVNNKEQLVSFSQIEYEIWPDKPVNDTRRRSLISRLRAKLKHKFITTLSAEGYMFNY